MWAAVIGGISTVIGALVLRKVQQVHVLVNSRLDKTLAEIASLKAERDKAGGQGAAPAP
jgi:hypothetical protein